MNTFKYVVISNKSEVQIRKERIKRLQQFAWQLRYAHVFWSVLTDKFKHRGFKNQEAKVRFFATAYNYGFMRAENEIEAKQFQKSFPYGINHKGEQVAYSDLAIEFLNRYATEF